MIDDELAGPVDVRRGVIQGSVESVDFSTQVVEWAAHWALIDDWRPTDPSVCGCHHPLVQEDRPR